MTSPLQPLLASLSNAPKFLLVGDPYTLLLSGEQTGGAFALIHGFVSPGFGPPPHLHTREAETFYVLSGEVTYYAHGTAHTLTAGGTIYLPKNVPHHFINSGATTAAVLIQVAPAGDFDNYLRTVGIPLPSDYTSPVSPPPPTPEHIQKVLSNGPSFGIHFLL